MTGPRSGSFCVRERVFETIKSEVEKNSFKRKGVSTQSPLCTKRTAAVLFAGRRRGFEPSVIKPSLTTLLSRAGAGRAGFRGGRFSGKALIWGGIGIFFRSVTGRAALRGRFARNTRHSGITSAISRGHPVQRSGSCCLVQFWRASCARNSVRDYSACVSRFGSGGTVRADIQIRA